MTDMKYSSTLTGAGFRLYEFKLIVALVDEGLTDEQIKSKVFNDNLFQQKPSSTKRSFPYILKRARVLDKKLREIVLNESSYLVKQINFYTIMKTDLLFFEFIDEVIKSKIKENNFVYERKDLNIFFNEKIDVNSNIASWSETTLKRLKSTYNKLLQEVGYLNDPRSVELIPVRLDDKLKNHLKRVGDIKYVKAMEG